MTKKLNIGSLVSTRTVSEEMKENLKFHNYIRKCLKRYLNNDWGEMEEEDKELNNLALENNDGRILAAYKSDEFEKIYIITEWDRSYTTILYANEY